MFYYTSFSFSEHVLLYIIFFFSNIAQCSFKFDIGIIGNWHFNHFRFDSLASLRPPFPPARKVCVCVHNWPDMTAPRGQMCL